MLGWQEESGCATSNVNTAAVNTKLPRVLSACSVLYETSHLH